MTHPSGAARPDGASTLEHVAEHRDAGSRAAWELKAKSIDASAERRKGKLERDVDTACDVFLAAAAAWRAARDHEALSL